MKLTITITIWLFCFLGLIFYPNLNANLSILLTLVLVILQYTFLVKGNAITRLRFFKKVGFTELIKNVPVALLCSIAIINLKINTQNQLLITTFFVLKLVLVIEFIIMSLAGLSNRSKV